MDSKWPWEKIGWMMWVVFGAVSLAMSLGWIQPWSTSSPCKAAVCSAGDSRLSGIWLGVIFMGLAGVVQNPRARGWLGFLGFSSSALAVVWIMATK